MGAESFCHMFDSVVTSNVQSFPVQSPFSMRIFVLPCIYLRGGREGMTSYSTCNTEIVVLPAGPFSQCFKLLISSENETFPFALV